MVPLCRLTGGKGNFRTYIVTGAPNGDWGKVVTGAPNGPPIHADWQKVQFLHLICYCCSKSSPYTGWLGKSAISAPTVSVVLQMVPHTCWLARSAISVPTLSVVLQMVPLYNLYWLTEEKCNFCTYFVTGALWLLRLTFWPHYNWSTNWSPVQSDCWNCLSLAPLYNWATKGSPIQADCWNVHILAPLCQWSPFRLTVEKFLVLISQWASKWPPYKADYLLTVWPYFSSGHEMGNLSFNIGGSLNGPLPFADSL